MDQDRVICTHCKGSGRMTVKCMTVTAKGKTHGELEIRCFHCDGSGSVTKDQLEAQRQEAALWCKCDPPSDRPPIFKGDGQCRPDCYRKHHYHCPDCGGVVQIG